MMLKDTHLFIRFMPKIVSVSLENKITTALSTTDSCLWFPHLTYDLVQTGWQRLKVEADITEFNYGTARVVLKNSNASRDIAHSFMFKSRTDELNNKTSVELLPKNIADEYKESGITFYKSDELFEGKTPNELLNCVSDALNIIHKVPSLFATIITLVKSVHLIKPEFDDYDVSFSEPHIPFSIFISSPRQNNEVNVLRVAEAIIHEAMHLQLTLIEKVTPLVASAVSQYYSPWRNDLRNIGGMLHALYVFRVIECFFQDLVRQDIFAKRITEYLNERRKEICCQANEVQYLADCQELTLLGNKLVKNLMKTTDSIKRY